jgi:hypothetical protein
MQTNLEFLGVFILVAFLLGLTLAGCQTIAPSMTPPNYVTLPIYTGLTFSINQQTPNYTGGNRPCSNARITERVVCYGNTSDFDRPERQERGPND